MRIFEVSKAGYVPRIRIINLVDILFILLLFFIATTTFRKASPAAVKLSLPEAKTAEELGKKRLARQLISVTSDGAVFLDQERVLLSSLEKRLEQLKAKEPELTLELSADRNVPYGTIVNIVDAARLAGIRNITAFTKKTVK
jgi:biopolymer transport protein ExbD